MGQVGGGHLWAKRSLAAEGICGRSTVLELEVETLPLSMLTRIRSSVSWEIINIPLQTPSDGRPSVCVSSRTHRGYRFKMADVAAHEEGRGDHEEVQHAPGKHGNVRLLP